MLPYIFFSILGKYKMWSFQIKKKTYLDSSILLHNSTLHFPFLLNTKRNKSLSLQKNEEFYKIELFCTFYTSHF